MGMEKFGTVSYTSIAKTAKFVDFLEDGKVMGTECKNCNLKFFPPRADCYKCKKSNVEWFPISEKGKLLTFTKAMYGPVGFQEDLPYTLAVVDFGDYKVFGRISKELKEDDIKIGMELTVKVIQMPNGQLSYEFIPA